MSDGPYRSLPMSRSWKRLAQCAENPNFDTADISSALFDALVSDWGGDVPAGVVAEICAVMLEKQGGLFPEQRIERIEMLRETTAGHGFARLLTDCAERVVSAGGAGEAALVEVASNALSIRGSRGIRSVEEHYYRRAPNEVAKNVRARLEEGMRNAAIGSLARELLNMSPASVTKRSSKHEDLDDGVPL